MIHYVAYLFPFLINLMLGGMFYITGYRFAKAGYPKLLITCGVTTWAILYSLVSCFMKKVLTDKNAPFCIYLGTFGYLLAAAGAFFFPNIFLLYLWMFILGCFGAVFCTAFQIFSKNLESGENGGVVRSTSLYTASWSFGMGTGLLFMGKLTSHGCYLLNAVFSLLIMLTMWVVQRSISKKPMKTQPLKAMPSEDADAMESSSLYKGMPDLVSVGWIGGLFGVLVNFIIRTLVPALTVQLHFGKAHGAFVLALLCLVQGITVLFLIRGRLWMYRRLPILLFSLCGIVAMILVGFCKTLLPIYIGGALFGIYAASFYFLFVFHSLIHPTKSSSYVATNELIVGLTGVISPFASGLITQHCPIFVMFLIGACLIIIANILQARIINRAFLPIHTKE